MERRQLEDTSPTTILPGMEEEHTLCCTHTTFHKAVTIPLATDQHTTEELIMTVTATTSTMEPTVTMNTLQMLSLLHQEELLVLLSE